MKKILLAVVLIASVAMAAGRVFDRSQNVRARRSDRGQVWSADQTYSTGTANQIASYAAAPCECAQVSRACSVPSSGILIDSRSISNGTDPVYSYCTKGSLTSSIAVGDMVGCAVHVPRIRPSNVNGTGALTVFTESKRWNYTINSEAFDQWQALGSGAAAPIVTADAVLNPANQLRAEKVVLAATTAGQLSELYTNINFGGGCPFDGGNVSASVYVSGCTDAGTTTGTIDIATYTGSAWEASDCNFSAWPTWTRCEHLNYARDTNGTPLGYFLIGNATAINGATNRPAQCVYLSKAQCEQGAVTTSPIDTGTAQIVSSADVVSVQKAACFPADQRTAWLGDSLSGLLTVGNSYTELASRPPELYAAATGRTVDNWANSGDTLVAAEALWTNYGSRTRAQRIVMFVGINDIVGADTPGASLWNSEQAWIQARAAEGETVTAVGLAPFGLYAGWTSGRQAQAMIFIDAGVTYCGANPSVCKFINIYPHMGDGGVNLLPAYEASDHLHFSSAGAQAAANLITDGG